MNQNEVFWKHQAGLFTVRCEQDGNLIVVTAIKSEKSKSRSFRPAMKPNSMGLQEVDQDRSYRFANALIEEMESEND